jgi:hypothetical protein
MSTASRSALLAGAIAGIVLVALAYGQEGLRRAIMFAGFALCG